jgi:NADH-quinone oxidoreductase subunit N
LELPFGNLVPEVILAGAATVCILLGLARTDAVRKLAQVLAALATLAALAVAIMMLPGGPHESLSIMTNGAELSTTALYLPILTAAAGFLVVLLSWNMPAKTEPTQTDKQYRGEYFAMLLYSLAGVSMVGKVNDLVLLFVVLELVSIPTYILVTISRDQIIAQEAGVKYFFLGALSAAIYLFGFSYLYGYAGSTRFVDITQQFNTDMASGHSVPMIATIGLLLAIVGIAYKIAAVPFHFYTPDVYQGAATPVTAYLAFGPKAAGFVAILGMLELCHFGLAPGAGDFHTALVALLSIMAALTMTIGNVLALPQRNIKRILAYSSIANSGYMLVGLVAGPGAGIENGPAATLFYLGSYAAMNLGAFAVLTYLQGRAESAEEIDDLAGVSAAHPFAAAALAICLLSLIGMPFTVGFLGKFFIIRVAFASGHPILAVVVIVNAAIAAAYYLRIIGAMYIREAWNPLTPRACVMPRIAAGLCAVGVILLGIWPTPLLQIDGVGVSRGAEYSNRVSPVEQPVAVGNRGESGAGRAVSEAR